MYFQTFSLTAFSSFLSPDVFLCSLRVPRGWNSSGQNPICCNHHGELWSDHVCHLCETLNALCWHADSVESVRRLLITNFGFTLLFMPRKLFMYSSQAVSQHSCPDRVMQKYFVRHCIIVTVCRPAFLMLHFNPRDWQLCHLIIYLQIPESTISTSIC